MAGACHLPGAPGRPLAVLLTFSMRCTARVWLLPSSQWLLGSTEVSTKGHTWQSTLRRCQQLDFSKWRETQMNLNLKKIYKLNIQFKCQLRDFNQSQSKQAWLLHQTLYMSLGKSNQPFVPHLSYMKLGWWHLTHPPSFKRAIWCNELVSVQDEKLYINEENHYHSCFNVITAWGVGLRYGTKGSKWVETAKSTMKMGLRNGMRWARNCSAGITNQTAIGELFKRRYKTTSIRTV